MKGTSTVAKMNYYILIVNYVLDTYMFHYLWWHTQAQVNRKLPLLVYQLNYPNLYPTILYCFFYSLKAALDFCIITRQGMHAFVILRQLHSCCLYTSVGHSNNKQNRKLDQPISLQSVHLHPIVVEIWKVCASIFLEPMLTHQPLHSGGFVLTPMCSYGQV